MGIYLKKEKVSEIFAEHGGSASNTGSVEGQIALFTFKIESENSIQFDLIFSFVFDFIGVYRS